MGKRRGLNSSAATPCAGSESTPSSPISDLSLQNKGAVYNGCLRTLQDELPIHWDLVTYAVRDVDPSRASKSGKAAHAGNLALHGKTRGHPLPWRIGALYTEPAAREGPSPSCAAEKHGDCRDRPTSEETPWAPKVEIASSRRCANL
jgi:hypothetical protein